MLLPGSRTRHAGFSMIEVLVTIVVVSFGLLGLAGLQVRMQTAQVEAYQRAQALLLLNDLAERVVSNRKNAATYVADDVGAPGATCATTNSSSTLQAIDSAEWCNAIQGAAELAGSSRTGAMIGGRGCVTAGAAGTNEYRITVAWQGLLPLASSDASVATHLPCGAGQYDVGNADCVSNMCRRLVTTVVRIGSTS